VTLVYIANRMQAGQPGADRGRDALRDDARHDHPREHGSAVAAKWFPFLGGLFCSSGTRTDRLHPDCRQTEHRRGLRRVSVRPARSTRHGELSVPLVLALIVFVSYNVEGIRAKGLKGYLGSLIPQGITGFARVPIFILEFLSNFMRLLSLSVRLFANLLAGHLIILFMSGGLAVLLGLEVLGFLTLPFGVILFMFELGLVATLQAFIFATLSAIYLGGAVAAEH
jgi:F-type H+-transporting ATPase subunit a